MVRRRGFFGHRRRHPRLYGTAALLIGIALLCSCVLLALSGLGLGAVLAGIGAGITGLACIVSGVSTMCTSNPFRPPTEKDRAKWYIDNLDKSKDLTPEQEKKILNEINPKSKNNQKDIAPNINNYLEDNVVEKMSTKIQQDRKEYGQISKNENDNIIKDARRKKQQSLTTNKENIAQNIIKDQQTMGYVFDKQNNENLKMAYANNQINTNKGQGNAKDNALNKIIVNNSNNATITYQNNISPSVNKNQNVGIYF